MLTVEGRIQHGDHVVSRKLQVNGDQIARLISRLLKQ
jgi:hypothetical protein